MIKSETAPATGNLGDEWIDAHGQSRFWDGDAWVLPAEYLAAVDIGSDHPEGDDSGDDESLPPIDPNEALARAEGDSPTTGVPHLTP